MTSRAFVDEFLAQNTIAVVGASRSPRKFGNVVFRSLRRKGYDVLPVNPFAEEIDGQRCWPSLRDLPRSVDGMVVVVPPGASADVVRAGAGVGIRRAWLQQGSESPEAMALCEKEGIRAVHGECILMFAEPVTSVHRLHRWLWRMLGKLPK